MRRKTKTVKIGNVLIGGENPIAVQSMTNTFTEDVEATVGQILELEDAGCDIVRVTLKDMKAVESVREIKKHIHIPLIGDIHFDFELAIAAAENGIDKIRINPGNIGGKDKTRQVIEACKKALIPIRIGVNSGSLEKDILKKYDKVTADGMAESMVKYIGYCEEENFSDIEKLKLNWLIYLIFGITLVWILELVQIILIDIIGKQETIAYKYIYAAVSAIIFIVTYKSLKQPELYSEVKLKEKATDEKIFKAGQELSLYTKSGLTETKMQEILDHLSEIIERDKPHLKSSLSLADLSTMLGISTHNLSEVINTKMNKSFYDFINYYRVEEVKKMLKDEKYNQYSILSVAFEAEFNSKSSFNNIFKKITGLTPSEFRRLPDN